MRVDVNAETRAATHDPRWRRLQFWCIVLLVITLVLRLFLAAAFPLLDEEAELWLLGRNPTMYAGEPPLPVWFVQLLLWSGGEVSKFQLRIGALLAGAASLCLTATLSRRLFECRRVAAGSLLLALCLPVPACIGIVLGPDSLLLVVHLSFLCVFWTALQDGRPRDWVLAGLLSGAAVLCRFSAVLIVAASAVYLAVSPQHRRWLTRREPWFALTGMVVAMAPLFLWNCTHGWASIQQMHDVWFHARYPTLEKLGEFLFEQLCHTGPFLALPFIAALAAWPKYASDRWRTPILFLRVQSLVMLVSTMIVAPVIGSHPQSTLLAYIPVALIVGALVESPPRFPGRRHLVPVSVATKSTLAVASLAGLMMLSVVDSRDVKFLGPSWESKFAMARRELFEWRNISHRLDAIVPTSVACKPLWFVLGRKPQALLSFYRGEDVVDLSALANAQTGRSCRIPVEWIGGDGLLITTSIVDAWMVRRRGWFQEVCGPRTLRAGPASRFFIWTVNEFRPHRERQPPPRIADRSSDR